VLPWFETREDALLTMRLPYLGARFASHRSPDEPTGRANPRPMTGSATSGTLFEIPHIAFAHVGYGLFENRISSAKTLILRSIA
jgi:hypothetical protein